MRKILVSDLLFPAFNKPELEKLPKDYGIEIFYEFGGDRYWDGVLKQLRTAERGLSMHGPCVTVNLADPEDTDYLRRYEETFAYAKKAGASHVVVHTNEGYTGETGEAQALVENRLHEIERIASHLGGARMLIENVGLKVKGNNLFDEAAYADLLSDFTDAGSIIDTGHAHANGWDIPKVIEALGSRIGAFHLHDNSGRGDEHLPILTGTIDWEPVMAAIRSYAPEAELVLEYANGDFPDAGSFLKHVQEVRAALKF